MEWLIEKHYRKAISKEVTPGYSCLQYIKMCLLQTWYSLSDCEAEDYFQENLTVMQICELELEDTISDHIVISRFRSEMI
jgi:IS5 family transposase